MPDDSHAALYDLHLASPPCSGGDQYVWKLGVPGMVVWRLFPAQDDYGSSRCGSGVSAASVDICTLLRGSAGPAIGSFANSSAANGPARLADAASIVVAIDCSVTGNGWGSS